jgi:cyclophilin family peptidyl-prolyl cis-trans isomerase
MRRFFYLFVALAVFGCTCTKQKGNQSATQGQATAMTIETEHGTIEIELFPKDAPETVARIQELANSGFYNGLTFHRVVPGFVVQGGDPSGNGTGGSGKKLKAEFNGRKHVEGTVAMARAQDKDSADSQFYISLGTHPHLDGSYTVFGQVKSGIEAVRKIKVGDKMKTVTAK